MFKEVIMRSVTKRRRIKNKKYLRAVFLCNFLYIKINN